MGNVNIKLNQFLHCSKCCHNNVCCIKKDYANEEISVPDTLNNFEIDIKCKMFFDLDDCIFSKDRSDQSFRDVETYFQKTVPDPGTGIEYLDNQPSCTTVEDDAVRLKPITTLVQQKVLNENDKVQIRELWTKD